MKKIIIIHENGNITGGSAKIAIQTAIGLSNAGYDVTYFCGTAPIDNQLKSQVKSVICLNQYELAACPSKMEAFINGLWNQRAYNELDKLLKTIDDGAIVHIHGWSHLLSSSIFKACNMNGIVPFLTLHDYFSVCPNGGFYNYKTNSICQFDPLSIKCILCNCDSRSFIHKCYRVLRQIIQNTFIMNNLNLKYIYISQFSLSKMAKYLKSNKFYYIHNPMDSYQNLYVNAKHNDIYLYIGRITPEKGVDIFCKAITDLGKKGCVIGDGPQRSFLEKIYSNLIFTGWLSKDEIKQHIKNSKCLIFPSRWYEGAPLTTEECLSAGIPCIVSDQCAAIEQIIDGLNGFVFKTNDVEDLKEKIKLIDNSDAVFDVDNWNFKTVSIEDYIDSIIRVYNEF